MNCQIYQYGGYSNLILSYLARENVMALLVLNEGNPSVTTGYQGNSHLKTSNAKLWRFLCCDLHKLTGDAHVTSLTLHT